ncbi:MAG: ABC transporter ATP-binding protein/permease [Candidatus Nomurabacteria bacterium]|jgi:ATP-binding cassette subfamily B protein|nr:ABC transporter ATP-binding protein/permease [Candidatus Nomurabacteria bacterium]
MANKRRHDNRRGGMPGGPMMMGDAKPKNFSRAMKSLWSVLRPHRIAISITVLLTIISTIFSIVSPKILGNMTNQIVDDFISIKSYEAVRGSLPAELELPAGTTVKNLPETLQNLAQTGQLPPQVLSGLAESQKNLGEASDLDKIPSAQRELIENLDLGAAKPAFHYEKLAEIALVLITLYVLSCLANYVSGWVLSGLVQRAMRDLRARLSRKINRLPIGYFDRVQYGDTLSRVTNDVDTIGQTLNQAFSQAISSVVLIVGVLAMMISISWLMTLVALGVLVISFVFVGTITKKTQKHFKSQQDSIADINGHVEENYAGQLIVKAYSAEAGAMRRFNTINQRLYASSWKSQFLSGLMMPLMQFIGNLGYVATAVLGGWLALNGRLSIGDIQAFIQYVSQMQQPITQVAQIMNLLQSTAAASERVFDFLAEPDEAPDPTNPQIIESVRGEVEFNGVNFGYEKGKKVIRNFNAHIRPGQKVAIVGPTGAGKTTIVNLLMRFYDVDSGTIKVDGVDTRAMRRADVRELFGMVLQDTWLTNGTIYENLAYGDLNADREQIKHAAVSAHVDHFVRSLPDGYDTRIDEDSENISVGEKQLLTIARAMLADAPMLILDEATSSVDTRTEVLIQRAMEKLTAGRTSFVIAHRLSTIKNADLILVMQNGNIIEQGTHRELLRADGFYAKLYNSQFAE